MGRRVLRRPFWGYSVCQCPTKGTPGLYELRIVALFRREDYVLKTVGIIEGSALVDTQTGQNPITQAFRRCSTRIYYMYIFLITISYQLFRLIVNLGLLRSGTTHSISGATSERHCKFFVCEENLSESPNLGR